MTTPAPTTRKIEEFLDATKAATDTAIQEEGGMITHNEFNRQSGLVYYYNTLAAKAERQLSTYKLHLELAEAEAAKAFRDLGAATGEKITEATVKEAVRRDPKVIGLEVAVIKSQEVLGNCKAVSEAMRHKKDMLIMRGNMTRDEIKARLSVEAEASSGVRTRHEEIRDRVANLG